MAQEYCEAGDVPQGLPKTLEGWHQKLDVYRNLARYAQETIANESLPQDVQDYARKQLADVSAVLDLPAVDPDDLRRIDQVRAAFFDAQSTIAELCAEAQQDAGPEKLHMLEGVAAALGDQRLAALFSSGLDGTISCENCQRDYSYQVFGDRMALYPLPDLNAQAVRFTTSEDFALLDYKDGAPNRAAGFVAPWTGGERSVAALRISELLAEQGDTETDTLLRLFTGSFTCVSCGQTARP